MFKLFLVIFFSLVVPSQFVYADVVTTLKEGRDTTLDVTKSIIDIAKNTAKNTAESTSNLINNVKKITKKEEKEEVELTRARAYEVWDDLIDIFDEIIVLKSKRDQAPSSSIFVKSKKDYDKKIDKILQTIAVIIIDPQIEDDRSDLDKLKQKIKVAKEKSSESNAKALLATGKDREKLIDRANSYEKDANEYNDSRRKLILNVKNRLAEYGLKLNLVQVNVLLSRVDASDIIGMSTSFSVIAELTQQLSAATIESRENLQIAKKYYFMHVILLELQMHIQRNYINRLENVYLVKLDNIENETEVLIDETSDLIKDSEGAHRNIFKNNLKSQKYTLKVIDAYEKILRTDLKKIKNGLKIVGDKYLVASNTYQTVTVSSDLVDLMEGNTNLFNAVMTLQVPELLPFQNLQMQEVFERLTIQLKE